MKTKLCSLCKVRHDDKYHLCNVVIDHNETIVFYKRRYIEK